MLEDGDTGGGEEDNDRLDTENLTATAAGLHHKTKFCSSLVESRQDVHGVTHF